MESLDQRTREIIRETAARHGAHSVRIFGSRARGDAGPSSDLDLLVEMERGRSLLDLIELEQELESSLGIEVDVVTPGALSPYFRDDVEAEAKPL